MHVFHGLDQVDLSVVGGAHSAVLTLGNFDGVHLGHQSLLAEVKRIARETGSAAGVMTFEPHPVKVLYPERGLKELYSIEEVLQALQEFGMDFVIVQTFDFAFSQLPPREFVRQLVKYMPLKHIVVGHDFSFGVNREGDFNILTELGREFGFTVSKVEPFVFEGESVSSTRIRRALAEGDVSKVAQLLGRPFALRGQVVKGRSRGRRLGFPTANIATSAEMVPRTGVYVTRLTFEGRTYQGVTNVGFNPTFADGTSNQQISVETHLFGVNEDIYGFEVRLEFLERLRDEKKFHSAEELVSQIQKDVEDVKRYFEENKW